jgi:hypothetical protein
VVNPNACAKRSEATRSGFDELEPGQVEHLDDGVLRTPRMLGGQRTLLAVQVVVSPVVTAHCYSFDDSLT